MLLRLARRGEIALSKRLPADRRVARSAEGYHRPGPSVRDPAIPPLRPGVAPGRAVPGATSRNPAERYTAAQPTQRAFVAYAQSLVPSLGHQSSVSVISNQSSIISHQSSRKEPRHVRHASASEPAGADLARAGA